MTDLLHYSFTKYIICFYIDKYAILDIDNFILVLQLYKVDNLIERILRKRSNIIIILFDNNSLIIILFDKKIHNDV